MPDSKSSPDGRSISQLPRSLFGDLNRRHVYVSIQRRNPPRQMRSRHWNSWITYTVTSSISDSKKEVGKFYQRIWHKGDPNISPMIPTLILKVAGPPTSFQSTTALKKIWYFRRLNLETEGDKIWLELNSLAVGGNWPPEPNWASYKVVTQFGNFQTRIFQPSPPRTRKKLIHQTGEYRI